MSKANGERSSTQLSMISGKMALIKNISNKASGSKRPVLKALTPCRPLNPRCHLLITPSSTLRHLFILISYSSFILPACCGFAFLMVVGERHFSAICSMVVSSQ